jgi:hypothetical protein
MRRLVVATALAAAVLTGPAAAAEETPEEKVEALVARYAELRREDDYTRARMNLIRSMGEHPIPSARAAVAKILRQTRSDDERIIGVHALGRIADAEAAKDLAEWVEKRKAPELFVALGDALGVCRDASVKEWLQGPALERKNPATLAACIHAVGTQQLPDALPRLTGLIDESLDVDVVHEAVRAIGLIGGDGAKDLLLRAAVHPDSRIRIAAADVVPLLDVDELEVRTIVLGLFADDSAQVIESLCRALGKGRVEVAVPQLIDVLDSAPRLRTRQTAYVALKAISKRDYAHDAGAWRLWWKHRNDPSKTPADLKGITYARYYGDDVLSDRVVFIVDLSGSMNWPWEKEPKRIDVARSQLLGVLESMPAAHRVNILAFANRVFTWQRSEQDATDANKRRAQRWVEKHFEEPDGDTLTLDALESAFEHNPEFDTIYLLSDGNPSHGRYKSPEGIRARVRVMNRYRRAAIHTIALTLESVDPGRIISAERRRLGEMKAFMKDLALDNGGTHRVVVRPPRD